MNIVLCLFTWVKTVVLLVVHLQSSAVETAEILEEKSWMFILAQLQNMSCVSMSWTLAIISCP